MNERRKNLQERANIAMMYNQMLGSGAWKHLSEHYLDQRLDPQYLMSFMHTEEGTMKAEMLKMQALWDLMGFIQSQITSGEKAADELRKVRESE
jgi:hypothetical protein